MAGITAKELAKRLGISPSAVSLALNDKPGVSRRTRNLVLETAMQLGYAKASALPVNNKTICFVRYSGGVISVAEHTSFCSFVLQGVEARAAELGYGTQIRYLNTGDMYNPQVLDALRQTDGIILFGTDILPPLFSEVECLLSNLDTCPVVVVDSPVMAGRLDCVINDCAGGARLAVEQLLKTGHRRIGYIRCKQRAPSLAAREQGLLQALKDAGEAPPMTIAVDVSSEGAFRDMDAWLKTHPELPDGIFADNDILAASAIRALKANGYRIPEDVSVIGMDDIPLCELLDPPLSTVRLCKEELGVLAMDQLHRRIQAGQVPHRMSSLALVNATLTTYLVPRSSVRTL